MKIKGIQRNVLVPASIVVILLFIGIYVISNSSNKTDDRAAVEASDKLAVDPSEFSAVKPRKVIWWHSMSGDNGKAVDKLVADFNALHKDIQVEAVYQGFYYECLTKLKASKDFNTRPSMIQVYDIGTRYMIDSKAVTPVQNFIDQDNYDTSQLDANITGYYILDNKLYSMPFNTSNPILYYNKDMFKTAGLDSERPPATFEEFAYAAQKTTKDGVRGTSFTIGGWYMEQFFANQGEELLNNGNGRDSVATASHLNAEAGLRTLTWWKGLADSKVLISFGSNDNTRKAFADGRVAMMLETTAALRSIIDSVGGKFEVGTGFLPKPADAKDGGVVVGGASNWIINNKSDAEQKAAWEFIKYLTEPEQQAFFHVNTGYFPVSKKAYTQQIVKDNMTKYPQFKTAIDQLHAANLNKATQGGILGAYPEAREITENAIEEVLTGQKTPKDALDAAVVEVNTKIADYNMTVK